jgi:glyoxylase-like metal-dependent hydrolase (beta-lactamase superfamily II)
MIITTPFFDIFTSTFSYILFDSNTRDSIIIDPVLDYDPLRVLVYSRSQELIKDYIKINKLRVCLILDTHIHADHMSAAFSLKRYFGVKSAIGEGFLSSQQYFTELFDIKNDLKNYEPAYDFWLRHNEEIHAGSISVKTLLTPGHTPSCASFIIGDSIFVGDTLFLPHRGCGRTDFPGGSAQALYQSVKEHIYSQPDYLKIYTGHDYPQAHEEACAYSFVKDSKLKNIMLDDFISEADFVNKRNTKDQSLEPPRLLFPAIQVNILGGQLPKANDKKQQFLRLPLSFS